MTDQHFDQGRYKFVPVLGRSHYANVFEAQDKKDGFKKLKPTLFG